MLRATPPRSDPRKEAERCRKDPPNSLQFLDLRKLGRPPGESTVSSWFFLVGESKGGEIGEKRVSAFRWMSVSRSPVLFLAPFLVGRVPLLKRNRKTSVYQLIQTSLLEDPGFPCHLAD